MLTRLLDRLRSWFRAAPPAETPAAAAPTLSTGGDDARFEVLVEETTEASDDPFNSIAAAAVRVVELPPASEDEWLFAVPRARPAVSEFCELIEVRLGDMVDLDALRAFQVAFDELLTNVVSYADGPVEAPIGVAMKKLSDQLIAEIRYRATAYDPTARAAVDTDLGIAEREIGGLGVHLVRELMERFEHQYVDGYNVLILGRRTGASPTGDAPAAV